MAFIEFVDYDPAKKDDTKYKVKTKDGKKKQVIKEMSLEEKGEYTVTQNMKAALAKKKRVRQMQNESRRINRK